jgi:hypothetical protein
VSGKVKRRKKVTGVKGKKRRKKKERTMKGTEEVSL